MENVLKTPREYKDFIDKQKMHDYQLEDNPTSVKFTVAELREFLSHYPDDSEILVHDILKGTSYLATSFSGCINPEDAEKNEDGESVRFMPVLTINHDYEFTINHGNNFYQLYGLISAITGISADEIMKKITSHEAFIEFINQIKDRNEENLNYLLDVWNKYDPYSKKTYTATGEKKTQE